MLAVTQIDMKWSLFFVCFHFISLKIDYDDHITVFCLALQKFVAMLCNPDVSCSIRSFWVIVTHHMLLFLAGDRR